MADQYITLYNIGQFFNTKDGNLSLEIVDDGFGHCKMTGTYNDVPITMFKLSGAFWKKIGYTNNDTNEYLSPAVSDGLYDFQPSPVILIQIDLIHGDGTVLNNLSA